MPAKAVARATKISTSRGRNFKTPLKLCPRSGVMFAEIQPIAVASGSPFAILRVAVKVVNAYEE